MTAKPLYTKKELSVFVEFLKECYQNTTEFYFGAPAFTQDNNPRGTPT
jgi:hypothetical protein